MDIHQILSLLESVVVVCLRLQKWLKQLGTLYLLIEIVHCLVFSMHIEQFVWSYVVFGLAEFGRFCQRSLVQFPFLVLSFGPPDFDFVRRRLHALGCEQWVEIEQGLLAIQIGLPALHHATSFVRPHRVVFLRNVDHFLEFLPLLLDFLSPNLVLMRLKLANPLQIQGLLLLLEQGHRVFGERSVLLFNWIKLVTLLDNLFILDERILLRDDQFDVGRIRLVQII